VKEDMSASSPKFDVAGSDGTAWKAKLGIEVELGMRSICPTSKAFDPKLGTAEVPPLGEAPGQYVMEK